MEKIFNGGYPSPLLPNGLKCVNTGAHFKINGKYFEAMSSEYSSHPTNIVSLYIQEGSRKIELSCWITKENDYKSAKFCTMYYSEKNSTHKHYSRNGLYKFETYKDILINAHSKIFNGKKEIK